jgi:cellulose biosynthesis protein BcsQ
MKTRKSKGSPMRIALFNHKGGVSKTTTTFNIGWMLAELGKTVVIVDTDPQCNLTGMVLGYEGGSELEAFYKSHPNQNIRAGLAPVFEARPEPIKPVECVPVPGQPRLLLLPGHIGLAEYEITLGIAQELSGSIQALQNVPGSIVHLIEETSKHHGADYTIIDMSPSLSSINQNLLMTSNFFLVPTSPDFFGDGDRFARSDVTEMA